VGRRRKGRVFGKRRSSARSKEWSSPGKTRGLTTVVSGKRILSKKNDTQKGKGKKTIIYFEEAVLTAPERYDPLSSQRGEKPYFIKGKKKGRGDLKRMFMRNVRIAVSSTILSA